MHTRMPERPDLWQAIPGGTVGRDRRHGLVAWRSPGAWTHGQDRHANWIIRERRSAAVVSAGELVVPVRFCVGPCSVTSQRASRRKNPRPRVTKAPAPRGTDPPVYEARGAVSCPPHTFPETRTVIFPDGARGRPEPDPSAWVRMRPAGYVPIAYRGRLWAGLGAGCAGASTSGRMRTSTQPRPGGGPAPPSITSSRKGRRHAGNLLRVRDGVHVFLAEGVLSTEPAHSSLCVLQQLPCFTSLSREQV